MIFRFSDCELDTRLGEVRRSGEPRHVEPQVFALLSYLVQNHDRLIGRDELVDAVWGHSFISEASLNSRLKSARQAIGDDGREQRMIRTLRGRGFRFVASVEVDRTGVPPDGSVAAPTADENVSEPSDESAKVPQLGPGRPTSASIDAEPAKQTQPIKLPIEIHRPSSSGTLPLAGPRNVGRTPSSAPSGTAPLEKPSGAPSDNVGWGGTSPDLDGPDAAQLAEQVGDSERPSRDLTRPLVGRDAECGGLRRLLEEAVAGHRRVVFLTGEAGIGKSALAEAFLRSNVEEGRVAVGQCVEQRGAGEAYLPVFDAVGRLCRGINGAQVLSTLDSVAPSLLVQMPSLITPAALEAIQRRTVGVSRERMLREMIDALEAISRHDPLVLLLEDLHWSDPSTLDLIVWLARRPEPARILVLATVRSGEPNRHLRDATNQLRRSGCFAEIALERWGPTQLRDYLVRRYPEVRFPESALEVLHRRSDGNPLFVQFLLEDWVRRGVFSTSPQGAKGPGSQTGREKPGIDGEGGSAALAGDLARLRLTDGYGDSISPTALETLAAEIPESLRALVEQRLETLSPEQCRVLEAAAVVGFDFTAALVAAALGIEEEVVDAAYEEITRAGGLIRRAGMSAWTNSTVTARYAFVHHLFQETVYDDIPFSKRRRLHLRIGEALESAGLEEEGPLANRLALHFQLAGDRPRAIGYLGRSAELALARSAHVEAIGHIEAALGLIDGIPEMGYGGEVELHLQRLLAPALLVTRGWSDTGAERAYLRAREIAQRTGDTEQLAKALYGMAYLYENRGEFLRSEAVLEERVNLPKEPERAGLDLEAYELLSCSLFHQGKFLPALENAQAAVAAFDPTVTNTFVASLGDNAGVASHYWQALALWFVGYPDRALSPIRASLHLAEETALAFMASASHFQAARLFYLRGELEAQLTHAQASLEIARRHGYPYHEGIVMTLLGSGVVRSGGGDAGIDMIRRGIARQVEAGADMERPFGLGLLAEALLRTDRIAEGLEAVGEALAVIQARCRAFFWESELYRLQGEMLLRVSRPDTAEESLTRAAEIADRQGARSLRLRVALSRHRKASGKSEREEAAALLRSIVGEFEEGYDTADLRSAFEALGEHRVRVPRALT